MSVVFEGVIVIADVEKLRNAGTEHLENVPEIIFQFGQIDSDLSVVWETRGPFRDEFVHLAARLSKQFGKALLIRYDNRVDTNASYYYENGEVFMGFDHEDEIFVEVDENLEPVPGSQQYTWDEMLNLSDEIEVETIRDAFDAGVEALGKGDRETVFNFVCDVG